MAGKKRVTNAEVQAANEIYEAARRDSAHEIEKLKNQIGEVAFKAEMATKIAGKDMDEAQARFLRVLFLRQAKEALKKKGKGEWTDFCRKYSIDLKNADYEIDKLPDMRDELLLKFGSFVGFEINKIKYLEHANSEKLGEWGGKITYDGEVIDDIPAFITDLKEQISKEREERDLDKKAHERTLKDKQKHVHKLERVLARHEKEAQAKGLSPEEDAFLQQMENLRIGFDGYMLSVEPGRMEMEEPTPLMRAEYLSTLWHMRARIKAAYDTAVDTHGYDLVEGEEDWQIPDK